MPEQQLTRSTPSGADDPDTGRRSPVRLLLRALLVVVVLAAAGALAGVLWEWWWTPPPGIVAHHQWLQDETGLRGDFSGTGTYVVVALVTGAVVAAAIAAVLDGAELVTLVAVLAGSVLAGWLMHRVGVALGPADPHRLATTTADGTELPGRLVVSGASEWRAFPGGALAGLVVVWLGLASKRARKPGPSR
jgi:fatty acid desaturase